MRQEAESEIIQLTMKIRNYESIDLFNGNEVKILDSREFNTGMMLWADQILVATNRNRNIINNQMRLLLGKKDMSSLNEPTPPTEGDKVICLRNYWETFSENQNSLINGTIGYLKGNFDTKYYIPRWAGSGSINVTISDFVTDDNDLFNGLEMDTHMIMTGEKCMDKTTAYKLTKNPRTSKLVPLEFTYGYAITYWKAQGSEWDKVLVLEENFPFDKKTHARAIYTAITRSSKKVVWLR